MNIAQKIKKWMYPLVMKLSKNSNYGLVKENTNKIRPEVPIDTLSFELNSGKQHSLAAYKGKKVMIVNTASDCGFTGQYAELQELYKKHAQKIAVIGFPANDFKEQEKANDKEIGEFCQINYGVTFPIAKKTSVIKSEQQHPLFKWLSDKSLNGWNDITPVWNFSKYIVDENGKLTHYFGPSISPTSKEVKDALGLNK